jgi:hypothetical protein
MHSECRHRCHLHFPGFRWNVYLSKMLGKPGKYQRFCQRIDTRPISKGKCHTFTEISIFKGTHRFLFLLLHSLVLHRFIHCSLLPSFNTLFYLLTLWLYRHVRNFTSCMTGYHSSYLPFASISSLLALINLSEILQPFVWTFHFYSSFWLTFKNVLIYPCLIYSNCIPVFSV